MQLYELGVMDATFGASHVCEKFTNFHVTDQCSGYTILNLCSVVKDQT